MSDAAVHDLHTPAGAPPPPLPMDTTTPAQGPVTRMAQLDFVEWGPWLLWRLKGVYPISDTALQGRLISYTVSNEFFFRKTRNACLLARVAYEPLDPRPFVREVFFLMTAKEHKDQAKFLYDELKKWAKALQATHIEGLGLSDLHPMTVRAMLDTEVRTQHVLLKL